MTAIKEKTSLFSLEKKALPMFSKRLEAEDILIGMEERIKTGISVLDESLEGGFVKGTVNLVGGGAGSGKSILSMQYLVNGIEQFNEPGVYVSFEESEKRLLRSLSRFSWGLKEKIKNKQLVVLSYNPEQIEKVTQLGGGPLLDTIQSINAKRIVFDSLNAFVQLHPDPLAQRKASTKLFEAIRNWGVTALMTAEQEPDPLNHLSSILEYTVDSVILLYNVRNGDARQRSLEIFKARSTNHSARIMPFKINDKGIDVSRDESIF